MNLQAVAAALCLLIWIYLAFVMAIPSGWVHLPLVAAVLLIVKAIVGKRPAKSDLPVGE